MAFMDAEIGRVLAELDALNFTQSTLVVLHGDHGWGLGEGNFWHKFSNMEHSARVPLLVRAPWLGAAAGAWSRNWWNWLTFSRPWRAWRYRRGLRP